MAPVDDRPLSRLGTRWGIGGLYVFALDGVPCVAAECRRQEQWGLPRNLLRGSSGIPRLIPGRRYTIVCCRVLTVLSTRKATYRMLTKVGGAHIMPLSDAMQLSDRVGWFAEPITERRTQPVKAAEPVSPGEMSSQ